MPTRNVNLTNDLERFILEMIESGRYENMNAVVSAALHTLERAEQERKKLAALRSAIDEGVASGIADGDVFGRVREKSHLSKSPR